MYLHWDDLNEEEKKRMINGYCYLVKMLFDKEHSEEEALNYLIHSKFSRDEKGNISVN